MVPIVDFLGAAESSAYLLRFRQMECTFGQFLFIFFAALLANIVTIIIVLFLIKFIYNQLKKVMEPMYNKMQESKVLG